MKFGLPENTIESIQKIFEQNSKLDEVLVFGSRAKGNYRPDSDIDFALKGRNISLDDILRLSGKIDELNLHYKIDLIDYNTITEKDLVEHIDRVGISFYKRWKEYKLGSIANYINRGISPKYVGENGIPVINQKCIRNGIVSKDHLKYHDSSKKFAQEKRLRDMDILINSTGVGTAGRVGFFLEKDLFLVDSHVSIVRLNQAVVNPKFVFYNLRKKEEEIENYAEGSTGQIELGRDRIRDIDILIPPLQEQNTITEILSSLDDKLDLLHRQNKTLEQLAETLFKQWFVEEAEESWEAATISDVADHLKESVSPSKQPNIFFNHYSLPAFDENRTSIKEIGKEILSNKYKVAPNSILVSKLNPRFPRIWPLYGNVDDNSICSTEFQIVKPKQRSWFGFIYCFLISNQVMQELTNASGGTSGSHQRVNPDDIFNLSFSLPSNELIERFDTITKQYWIKIKSNYNQIKNLTQLRDNLLPKLMSGEVRVEMN
ncbi:MAG TPA: restriction endonuclease subunit S [Chitinophagaceae bacterium]